jgi:transposase
VQTVLEQDPFGGHVFVFRGRRGDLIKLLWWDGDGLCNPLPSHTKAFNRASASDS